MEIRGSLKGIKAELTIVFKPPVIILYASLTRILKLIFHPVIALTPYLNMAITRLTKTRSANRTYPPATAVTLQSVLLLVTPVAWLHEFSLQPFY